MRLKDDGRLEQRPWRPRIAVATPRRYGDWCPEYDDMIRGLLNSPAFDILGVMFPEDDICRARARVVRLVLASNVATHLLMLDNDVSVDPQVIGAMFRADRDVVCCPYPKKASTVAINDMTLPRTLDETLKRHTIRTLPEWRPDQGIELDAQGCWEIASMGLGCCLVKRAALERMVEAYAPHETIIDLGKPTVDLFDLVRVPYTHEGAQVVTEAGYPIYEKLSEDHSFFERWRAVGGKVWLYMGPGTPAKHFGRTTFESSLKAFGLREAAA
jgi:hypothetical protein